MGDGSRSLPGELRPGLFQQLRSLRVRFLQRLALQRFGARQFRLDLLRISQALGDALTPLFNMGQVLYDPPDVAGWDAGRTWFSTGAMLARMNFAALLASNQRFNLARTAKPFAATPASLLSFFLDELVTPRLDSSVISELTNYLRATGAWTGSDAQLQAKAPGLVHLIAGLPEYQFV